MRRNIYLWIGFFTLSIINGTAQTNPFGINYQAIARDQYGKELTNTTLDIRFSILNGSPNGKLEWEELHNTRTNEFGLFNLIIGQGERTSGSNLSFNEINWGSSIHYLKVEVKIDQNFISLGAIQLTWVPYALYALNAGSADIDLTYDAESHTLRSNGKVVVDFTGILDDADNDVTNEIQSLSYDPVTDHLTISKAEGVVDLRALKDDADADPENEIQNLVLEGNILKLQKGALNYGQVSVDINPENEIQDLYEEKDTIFITKKDLPRKIDLTQKLTVSGNKLSIKRGNTISIDADTTNEIQDLQLYNDILKITGKQGATLINLTPYKDNSDSQTISLNEISKTIAISNGNAVDASNLINVPWVSFSANNLSNQSLPGAGSETIVTWSEEFDDGNCLENNTFIANNSGTYNLSFNFVFYSSSNLAIKIYKNDDTLIRFFDSFGSTFSHTMLLKLNAGESIKIKVLNTSAIAIAINSAYFSGYRVQ